LLLELYRNSFLVLHTTAQNRLPGPPTSLPPHMAAIHSVRLQDVLVPRPWNCY